MKKLIILILAVAGMALACSAQSDRLFASLADMKGVQSVYVGKAALRFAKNVDVPVGGVELGGIVDDIESIEILQSEAPDVAPRLEKEVHAIIDRLKLDIIMEAREDGESVVIYGRVPESGDVLKSIVIESRDGSEYCIVFIRGSVRMSAVMGD